MNGTRVAVGFRIVFLLLLIIALGLGGMVWFDYLGIMDARKTIAPVYAMLGARKPVVDTEDPNLLDRERMAKQVEALAEKSEGLANLEKTLKQKDEETRQKVEQLAEKEKALEDREKVFNERLKAYENRRVNLQKNADYLVGMPPANAVKILLAMEDMDIVDLFRITEEQAVATGETSLVAYWLSLMPPDRAAVLQRKMGRGTGG